MNAAHATAIRFHSNDAQFSRLDRREGLAAYLKQPRAAAPAAVSEEEFHALSKARQHEHDNARITYLSSGVFLPTAYFNQAWRTVRDCFELNHAANTGKTGMILSGEGTVGKTTIAKHLMKGVYRDYTRQFPQFERFGRIPVIYIEVPAASSPKTLMLEFAEHLGLAHTPREDTSSLRIRVTQAIRQAGTQLIVIDELHNLDRNNTATGKLVQILKELHDDLDATFVFAGIRLVSEGALLSGSLGRQIAGRYSVLDMQNFPYTTDEERKIWNGLLDGFEKRLPLRDLKEGTLVRMSRYLWERTNGNISSLAKLITGAAITIIRDQQRPETLTIDLLDTRTLDYAAEFARKNRGRNSKHLERVRAAQESVVRK